MDAMAKCNVVEFVHGVRAGDAIYDFVPGKPYVLVPTLLKVACVGIAPGTRTVVLPKNALPFGLLTSITMTGGWFDNPKSRPPAAAVSIRVEKATGISDMTLKANGSGGAGVKAPWCVEVDVSTPLGIAQDAVDRDFKVVKENTGHVMMWRAIAAGAIGAITLTFPCPGGAPVEFGIEFRGVNGVLVASPAPAGALASAPADGPPPPPTLLLPPLVPAARLAQLQDREQERRASAA